MELGVWRNNYIFQRLEFIALWIYITWSAEFDGAWAERCRKKFTDADYFQVSLRDSDDDDYLYTNCMWGCCYTRDTPCCTAPVSLIIGCAVGGILIIALATVAICCCWVCRRRNQATRASRAMFGETPRPNASAPVVYRTDSSGTVDLPPYAFDAPPSYEEVMRGETNAAFKPDS
nr:hypothetical protein BgiMline_031640 [Biomphalaria glabrata]